MKRSLLPSVTLALVALAGCTTAKITDYQAPATSSMSGRTAQVAGVEVALDPFVEKERTQKYFDLDAVGNGIAILHVRVVNHTADETFLVQKTNIKLIEGGTGTALSGGGNKDAPSSAGQTQELTAVALYGVGSEVLGVGFLLAGMAKASHAEEIQRNFISKEMPDQTLSPGKSMEGFIYFKPVTPRQDWSRSCAVKMELTETKTQQPITVNIPLER